MGPGGSDVLLPLSPSSHLLRAHPLSRGELGSKAEGSLKILRQFMWLILSSHHAVRSVLVRMWLSG